MGGSGAVPVASMLRRLGRKEQNELCCAIAKLNTNNERNEKDQAMNSMLNQRKTES
jgi:hypothetical protein